MSDIKICGLFRDCDIDHVNEARPDYAGFILDFPKSHRSIDPKRAGELKKKLAEGIKAVGVFVNKDISYVIRSAAEIGLDVIQLHGSEDNDYIDDVREQTHLPVWKAFKVRNVSDLDDARHSRADEILLDNGYGTGGTFDWSLISDYTRSFILAGGLTPENIPEALRLFSPKVIDISSGVETEGVKDRHKIMEAVRAVRNGVL